MASVELFARLIFSLVVIGGLVLLARRALQGRLSLDRSTPGIEILARRQIGPKAGLVLVRCGAQTLLLGTEGERISLLASGDELHPEGGLGHGGDPEPTSIDLARLEQLSAPGRPALAAGPAPDGATLSVDEVLADLGPSAYRGGAETDRTESYRTQTYRTEARRHEPTTARDTDRILAQLLQERSTDQPRTGARTHQSGPRSAPTRMSVIEALREVTVRKG